MLCADLTTHHLQFLQTEETRDCQRAIDEEDRMENLPGPLSPWKRNTNQSLLLWWFKSAIIPGNEVNLITSTMIKFQLMGVETYSHVNFDIVLYISVLLW